MVDRTYTGWRCKTKHLVEAHEGVIPANSLGTIRYGTDSLGRPTVLVDWDDGRAIPVFLKEVEILGRSRPLIGKGGKDGSEQYNGA